VGKKTEIANAHETRRQYVQEKATQELTNLELRQSLFVVVFGVPPAEGYHPVV